MYVCMYIHIYIYIYMCIFVFFLNCNPNRYKLIIAILYFIINIILYLLFVAHFILRRIRQKHVSACVCVCAWAWARVRVCVCDTYIQAHVFLSDSSDYKVCGQH